MVVQSPAQLDIVLFLELRTVLIQVLREREVVVTCARHGAGICGVSLGRSREGKILAIQQVRLQDAVRALLIWLTFLFGSHVGLCPFFSRCISSIRSEVP